MNKTYKRILLFLILTLIGYAAYSKVYPGPAKWKVTLYNKERIITQVDVEIADTPIKRERGLMLRERLDQMEGMFFIFNEEAQRFFWMKNTFIPLDIIFISRNLQVVSFIRDAQPCKGDPCKEYPSKYPAMYVLEVNSGFVDQYGINNRTRIEILSPL